jgi:hypothetical protein
VLQPTPRRMVSTAPARALLGYFGSALSAHPKAKAGSIRGQDTLSNLRLADVPTVMTGIELSSKSRQACSPTASKPVCLARCAAVTCCSMTATTSTLREHPFPSLSGSPTG